MDTLKLLPAAGVGIPSTIVAASTTMRKKTISRRVKALPNAVPQ
jgi:hypothetical protein